MLGEPWNNELIAAAQSEEGPIPALLFHYTSLQAVCAILDGQELHFTQASFTNDNSEFMHGLELVTRFYKEKCAVEHGATAWTQMATIIPSFDQIVDIPFCLFSMSRHGDLLSQWRSYGDANGCYAIGFSTAGFEEWLPRAPLVPCHYAETVSDTLLSLAWQCLMYYYAGNVRPDGQIMPWDAFDARLGLVRPFAIMAATLKHHSFAEEREWRVLLDGMYWGDALQVKQGRLGGPVPYLAVRSREQRDLPIVSIRIGPNVVDPRGARERLLQRVAGKGIELLESAIPFRHR
jgi:hypothetical protein